MYKVLKNNSDTGKVPRSGVRYVNKPNCEYGVYYVANDHQKKIVDVMDYLENPKGVGEGIARIMNEQKKYKLPI